MNTKNHTNEYAGQYPQLDDTPKTVVAAVAYSLALRLVGDDHALARAMLAEEWVALHDGGIVPQKPVK